MRCILFFLLLGTIQITASVTYSQSTKLSMSLENVPIQEVLSIIEQKSSFYFTYNVNQINTQRKVSIIVKEKTVAEILNQLFEKDGIRYQINDTHIVLYKTDDAGINQNGDVIRVTGTVIDQNGEIIVGANIVEKGTTNGTITDAQGNFSLNVAPDAVLLVSFISYNNEEVPVKGGGNFNIRLTAGALNLEEVVVIGYGTARKRDLTGAISSIRTEKLEIEAPRSIEDLLRANSAGVNINMSTGAKGDASIQIRGQNTLKAGSSPLIVLDGVIYDGSLSDINPMDVASVDVLKDASAAAIYGAKAANGVIVFTTKKGKTGKPIINFNANIGLVQPTAQPRILDADGFVRFRQDYEIGRNSDDYHTRYPQIFEDPRKLQGIDQLTWYNYDKSTPATSVSEDELITTWLGRLDFKSREIENYLSGNITHWDDLVFQNGLQQDYTASVSNRNEDVSYYWSMGYADREGIVTGDRFKVFRTRLNLDSKITNFLTVGVNANFSSRNEGFMSCDWSQMTRISPFGANEIDDKESPYRQYPTGDMWCINPFYDNSYRDLKKMFTTFNANVYGVVKLPFSIEYQMNFVPNYEFYEYYNHDSSEHAQWHETGGSATRETRKQFTWFIDNIIRWEKQFGMHKFNVTLLANAEKGQKWSQKASSSNFSPNDILGYHRLQAGTVPKVSSEDTYRTGDALMARLIYTLKDRYILTASIRRDGYSAFGQRNPHAYFPAIALGWNFSSEKFMQSFSHWLNYAKLRVSWGENGNRDIGMYDALSDLKSELTPLIDQNGNLYVSSELLVNRMANVDLKWERTSAYNIGLDFSLFDEKLGGSIDAYLSRTNDLLLDRSLPEIIGFKNVVSNLGQLQNKGMEITLNSTILRRKDFEWYVSGNLSFNRRKINKLYGDMVDVLDDNGNVIGKKEADDITNKWFIGQDPDRIWDYERNGVWQLGEEEEAAKYGLQPGDFRYVDQNEDGLLTNDDKVFQGYRTPRFRWSLRNEFRFLKDISLSFMLYSHWGQYGAFNNAANSNGFPDRCSEFDLPRWTLDNPVNDYARIGSNNKGTNYVAKSFIRLENISLSYNVPSRLLSKLSVQNMRLSFTCRNVAVFSPHWKFWDPEQSKPTPRTFNLSVNFTL